MKGRPWFFTDGPWVDIIRQAAGLNQEQKKPRVLDLMSGPGLLATNLKGLLPKADIVSLDFAFNQLGKIDPAISDKKVQADASVLPFKENSFDTVICRLALKDLTEDTQQRAIREVYRILKPGGSFVIADMVSPPEEAVPNGKKWLNRQHALKQEMAGRNPLADGVCHIPTADEYLSLLSRAGFDASIFAQTINWVNTGSWVESRQITEAQRKKIDQFIAEASTDIKEYFKIQSELDNTITLGYPLTIFRALRPVI